MQAETRKILAAYKEKPFYYEDSQALEQAVPRGGTVSVFRHFQDQTGKTPSNLAWLHYLPHFEQRPVSE